MPQKNVTQPRNIIDTATRPINQMRVKGSFLTSANQPFWRLLGAIFIGGMFLLLGAYWIGTAAMLAEIPVSMRSSLRANYSADPYSVAMQPVKLNLISDALIDGANNAAGEPVVQLATVVDVLRTPVPTITPFGTAFPLVTPTLAIPNQPGPTDVVNRTPVPTVAQQTTLTPGLPTATLASLPTGLVPTVTVSYRPSLTPTLTLKPGGAPTATSSVPTVVNTPTKVYTSTVPGQPTSTLISKPSITPSHTPVKPTSTPVPPTHTPVPPTNTPVLPTDPPKPPTSTPDPGYPPPPPAPTETVPSYP